MTEAIASIALFVVLAFFLFVFKLLGRGPNVNQSLYTVQHYLLSGAERSFLGVLMNAIGPDYFVAPKVRIADAVAPRKGMSRSDWQRAFNRISAKHFDYLICRASDFHIIAAVELDDKTHRQARRRKRDEFLEEAVQGAGLPLLRFDAKSSYAQAQIRDSFSEILGEARGVS